MPKDKYYYMKFAVADYLKDTRHLSLAARGAWIEILCQMFLSPTSGKICMTPIEYARLFGCMVDQAKSVIDELNNPGVTSARQTCDRIDLSDGRIELVSRRMMRDEQDRIDGTNRKRKERAKNAVSENLSHECHANVTAMSQGESESESESDIKSSSKPKPDDDLDRSSVTQIPKPIPKPGSDQPNGSNPPVQAMVDEGIGVVSAGNAIFASLGIGFSANASNARAMGRLCTTFGKDEVLKIAQDSIGMIRNPTAAVLLAYVEKTLANRAVSAVVVRPEEQERKKKNSEWAKAAHARLTGSKAAGV